MIAFTEIAFCVSLQVGGGVPLIVIEGLNMFWKETSESSHLSYDEDT